MAHLKITQGLIQKQNQKQIRKNQMNQIICAHNVKHQRHKHHKRNDK